MKKIKRFSCIILTALMVFLLVPAGMVNAADDSSALREVHRVKAGKAKYCFFVTRNVILTPDEIDKMGDSELSKTVIARSGLYIKKSNCRKSDQVITVKEWSKQKALFLDKADIDRIRNAEPADGSPVKLHMDVRLTLKPYDPYAKSEEGKDDQQGEEGQGDQQGEEGQGDQQGEEGQSDQQGEEDQGDQQGEEGQGDQQGEEGQGDQQGEEGQGDQQGEEGKDDQQGEEGQDDKQGEDGQDDQDAPEIYSTYKLLSPELIYIVVATKNDAAAGEDDCKEEKPSTPQPQPDRTPYLPDSGADDEMLPELKTINMADRTGKPVKATLEDGDPVTLEWIEPSGTIDIEKGKSLIENIPGGYISLAAVAVCAAVIAVIAVKRKKRNGED